MVVRRSGGFFFKFLLTLLVVTGCVVVIMFFNSPQNPFAGNKLQLNTPSPVLVNTITREFKLITAQVTGQTTVEGESSNILPFSTEHYDYQVVLTVTAGIDLTRMQDSDIKTEGDTVTITLPQPEVIAKEKNGQVLSRSQELFSGLSSDKNIVDKMQVAGEAKVLDNILKEGRLFREARQSAEMQLRNFILQLGFREVKFS